MIKKFKDFLNEDTNIGGMELQGVYPLDIDTIYEISIEDLVEMQQKFFQTHYELDELIQLNEYFGLSRKNDNVYSFKKSFGGFGEPVKKLSGLIKKYKNVDEETKFVVELFVKVKIGKDYASDSYLLLFNTLEEMFEFMDSFEN